MEHHLTGLERYYQNTLTSLHSHLSPHFCSNGIGRPHPSHHATQFYKEVGKLHEQLNETERRIRDTHGQISVSTAPPEVPSLGIIDAICQSKDAKFLYRPQFRIIKDVFQDILQTAQEAYAYERGHLRTLCRSYASLGEVLVLHLNSSLNTSICSSMVQYYKEHQMDPQETDFLTAKKKLLDRQQKLYVAVKKTQEVFLPLLKPLFQVSQKKLLSKEKGEEFLAFIPDLALTSLPSDGIISPVPQLEGLYHKTCGLIDAYFLEAGRDSKQLIDYFKTKDDDKRKQSWKCQLAQSNLEQYYQYLRNKQSKASYGTGARLDQLYEYDKQNKVLHETCTEIIHQLRQVKPKKDGLEAEVKSWSQAINALESWQTVKRALVEYTKEELDILKQFRTARFAYYRSLDDEIAKLNQTVRYEIDMYLGSNEKLLRNLFAYVQKQHQFTLSQTNQHWQEKTKILNTRFAHLKVLYSQVALHCPRETEQFVSFENKTKKAIEQMRSYAEQAFNQDYFASLMLHVGYIRHFLTKISDGGSSEIARYLSSMDKFCYQMQNPDLALLTPKKSTSMETSKKQLHDSLSH